MLSCDQKCKNSDRTWQVPTAKVLRESCKGRLRYSRGMPFVARVSIILLSLLCALVPAPALIATKPLFESLRPRTVNRMTDSKIVADLILPVDAPVHLQDKKGVISTVITASYMSIIVSIMALPVTLSAMSADIAFYGVKTKGSFLSEIVFAATIAIVSKLLIAALYEGLKTSTAARLRFLAVAADSFIKSYDNDIVRADASVCRQKHCLEEGEEEDEGEQIVAMRDAK